MSTIHIPDDLYAKIAERPAQEGQPVDAIVTSWLAREVQTTAIAPANEDFEKGYDPATDPLAQFAGMYASNDPGWIARHDEIFVRHHADKK